MLSKSKFIIGQQCQKYLWLKDKGIQITNIPDESAKERLRAGNEVGEEAKNLFPGGINIEYHKKDFNKMCEITKEAIRSGNSTIYEASFFEEGVFIRVDIMQKTPNGWNIYEVKSSSRLRSYHKEDATLQWAVLSKVKNLKLNEVFVITLNNEYSKEGKIIPEELFTFHPLTKFVSENLNKTNSQLHDIKNSLLNDKEPDISIGKHCKKPHQCEYFNRCWPESITENNSIMNLYRLNFDKKVEFIKKGKDVFEINDPKEAFLPKSNVSTKYIFARNDDFFAYPNNYNHYVKYYRNTFQHGGISLEEMIIPVITMKSK